MKETEGENNLNSVPGSETQKDTGATLRQIFSLTADKVKGRSQEEVNKVVRDYLGSMFSLSMGQMVYVVDYSRQEIIFSSGFENNLGLSDPITVNTLYEHIHPADILTVLKLAKASVSYIVNTKSFNKHNWALSHDYRLKNFRGEYKRFLRYSYIASISENLEDFITVNILTDITFIKPKGEVQWRTMGKDFSLLNVEIEREMTRAPERSKQLSNRETEVLQLLALGNTSDQVANKLHISPMTSATHRRNIMKKLKAKNTNELIYMAVKDGVL